MDCVLSIAGMACLTPLLTILDFFSCTVYMYCMYVFDIELVAYAAILSSASWKKRPCVSMGPG